MEDSDFDPTRRLCPDGACVGLIGPDGRCTVCGRTPEAAAAGEEAPESAAAAASGAAGEPVGESGGFDPNRRLCEDGSCVGLIGADGVCNVCGQKAGG